MGACKNKWTRPLVQKFNRKKEENLQTIALSLWFRTYKPKLMLCKMEHKPRKREVFVPAFEDEIVDYLYKIYTDEIYLRLYIQDLYSGIKGRGTKYGVERLEMHIRQESRNYTEPCYVLKGDIKGYYPHMIRQLLYEICLDGLRKMSCHRITKRSPLRWCDVVDMDFVEFLTGQIALQDPTENCKRVSPLWEWDDFPPEKSFFHMEKGRGVPPGKVTSNTFGNIYLNALDHHMKRDLFVRHNGRFTDDFYAVSSDREFLLRLIPEIDGFLRKERGLELHKGKTRIFEVRKGVPFLGAFRMPSGCRCSATALPAARWSSWTGMSPSGSRGGSGMCWCGRILFRTGHRPTGLGIPPALPPLRCGPSIWEGTISVRPMAGGCT